ncbi:hypothetical protein ACXYTU_24595, partial [Klebsiella pneumoniae]
RAYCLKIQPATGSFARNLIYSTKPLGRKSCVPSELIYQGIYDSAEAAWQQARTLAESKRRTLSYRVIEGEGDGDVITLNDVPVQFGRHKRYRDRQVTVLECG